MFAMALEIFNLYFPSFICHSWSSIYILRTTYLQDLTVDTFSFFFHVIDLWNSLYRWQLSLRVLSLHLKLAWNVFHFNLFALFSFFLFFLFFVNYSNYIRIHYTCFLLLAANKPFSFSLQIFSLLLLCISILQYLFSQSCPLSCHFVFHICCFLCFRYFVNCVLWCRYLFQIWQKKKSACDSALGKTLK